MSRTSKCGRSSSMHALFVQLIFYCVMNGKMTWTSRIGTRRLLSEASKKQVAASQLWCCASCKTILPAAFQVDHIMPLAVGGSNEMRNLAALCPNCHASKTQNEDERVRAFRGAVADMERTSAAPCWYCGGVYSTYFKHTCSSAPAP